MVIDEILGKRFFVIFNAKAPSETKLKMHCINFQINTELCILKHFVPIKKLVSTNGYQKEMRYSKVGYFTVIKFSATVVTISKTKQIIHNFIVVNRIGSF